MTQKNEIYRCTQCGTIVEVLTPGTVEQSLTPTPDPSQGEEGVCGTVTPPLEGTGEVRGCNTLEHLVENTTDAAREKHVPVVEKVEGGWHVTVGSVEHPMTEDHYIQWIELITERDTLRHHLLPGEKPEATFLTEAEHVVAREYCNLHGLWKAEV